MRRSQRWPVTLDPIMTARFLGRPNRFLVRCVASVWLRYLTRTMHSGGFEQCMLLSGLRDFVAWLQISQVPMGRAHCVSLPAEFVKEFLTKFVLDIATPLSYKATESFP
jgi:hypothetical protein